MFSTSSYSRPSIGKTPFSKQPPRLSEAFGTGTLSFSQEESGRPPRRASIDIGASTTGGGGGSSRRSLECGIPPAPISYLYTCRNSESGAVKLYGSSDVGPVSLIGLPRCVSVASDSVVQFELSDGSGSVLVKIDIPSEQQWLREILLNQLPPAKDFNKSKRNQIERSDEEDAGSGGGGVGGRGENRKPEGAINPVRVIGVCEFELTENNLISLRGLHARIATPEEYGFYHTILAALNYAQAGKEGGVTGPAKKAVTLPMRFERSVRDEIQRFVLATILAQREDDLGMPLEDLLTAGRTKTASSSSAAAAADEQIYQAPCLQNAVDALDAAGHVLLISNEETTYIDIMPPSD